MAFWGVEVKAGKSFTILCEKPRGRLRISQATMGIGESTKKCIVQCNVGNKIPVFLCALVPNYTESCHLDLEFEEADDVVFSVIGPRSVYLTGYYVRPIQLSNPHSDTESFGVDIENSQSEGSIHCSEDDQYEDSFIDDEEELQTYSSSSASSEKVMDESTPESNAMKKKKGRGKRLKKKYHVVDSDTECGSQKSEEDEFLLSGFKNKRSAKITANNSGEKIDNKKTVKVGDDKLKNDGVKQHKKKSQAVESDSDTKSCESGDEDGYLLSIFKNKKSSKTTSNNAGEKIDPTLEKECDKSKKDVKSGHKSKKGNPVNEIIVEKVNLDLVDGSKVETHFRNQKPAINEIPSPDLAKPRKKRKGSKGEQICDIDTDKDHNTHQEDEGKTGAKSVPPESNSEKRKKAKKRSRALQSGGTQPVEIGTTDDKLMQDSVLHPDSLTKDIPVANEDHELQIHNNVVKPELPADDSQPRMKSKTKKNMKKETQLDVADNQENTFVKPDKRTRNARKNQKKASQNGE